MHVYSGFFFTARTTIVTAQEDSINLLLLHSRNLAALKFHKLTPPQVLTRLRVAGFSAQVPRAQNQGVSWVAASSGD